jgi:hypothetical protein
MREQPIRSTRRETRRGQFASLGVAFAVLALGAAPAGAVQVTCGSTSGLAGQTVEVAINTASLTGLHVRSFQFVITYPPTVVTPVSVSETGTLAGAAAWNNATFGVTSGRIAVSDAGATELTGSGALIKIQFQINPSQLAGTTATLTMASANFLFNEGTPADTAANGSIVVNPTPIITVSPNTGEVIRTQTLQFTVSGSVTNPVSWFTTNPSVATINASGLLTGQSPGACRVYAVDNATRRDTTDQDVLIRGMGVTSGTQSVIQGLTMDVPITVTSLSGLGIRSGQITLNFNSNLFTALSLQTPAGTLLNGYGPTSFGTTQGTCSFGFSGGSDLAGTGVLAYVRFRGSSTTTGAGQLAVAQALFNETLPAKTTNGTISVTTLPSIIINPDNWTLLAGQTKQFTLAGSPTLPAQWSTLDPSIATISATGLLSAVAGGVTKVHVQDAVGATDENSFVQVYDFQASLPTVVAPPGATVRMPILTDRPLNALRIRSLQYTLTYNPSQITSASAQPWGLVSAWGPGGLIQNPASGSLVVASAGSDSLSTGSSEIQVLLVTLSPSVPSGTNVSVTLNNLMFNEGKPSAQVVNGVIQVRNTGAVEGTNALSFSLGACEPNPAREGGVISYALPADTPAGARVRLAVYGVDGRRVRSLLDEPASAGRFRVRWDGRDDGGRRVAAGVYFYRLSCGSQALTRKLAVTP